MGKANFDKGQAEAIETFEGQWLVIAGAGSGKTKVLTHRVGRLIQKGVAPGEMLVFTFTNDAANEMKTRLMAIVGDHVNSLNVGTIHSQLNRMLRESIAIWKPRMLNYKIMDSWEQLKFVKDCFKELRLESNNFQNPKIAIRKIGVIKNGCMTVHDYIQYLENLGVEKWKEEWFIDFYSYYERMREMNRMIGFDDMLSETYWMFKEKPEILEAYRNKFRFILMDEFQDTNKVQLEVTRMLQSKYENFFAVGDPRQSIYAFRGAIPEYAVNFKDHFQNGKIIELEYNYRCPKNIIELGNDLMDHAEWKFSRTKPYRKDEGHIQFYDSFMDGDEEAEAVVEEIQALIKTGSYEYKDVAVLYRTNAQSRPLEESLIRRAMPYKVEQSFYQSAEIKDLIAFIKYVHNDKDIESLERIVNKPNRYLGQSFWSQLKEKMKSMVPIEALKCGSFSHKYMNENALAFAIEIEYIRSLKLDTVGAYMNVVRQRLRYDEWVSDNNEESVAMEKIEKLDELSTVAHHFKTIPEFLDYLAKLENCANGNGNAVELKTIHRSKGLEFKVVFVIGVSDGILPHSRATDVEEERRLLYVAITRAIERVYISHVLSRFDKPIEPSRFLAEIGFEPTYDDIVQKVVDGEVATVREGLRKAVANEIRSIEKDIIL